MAPRKRPLPSLLPSDWILRDTEKRKWRLGKIIGKGGFGVIYLASDCVDAPVPEDTNYVIKVEFRENGPLFSELKFYQRAAKLENINKWKRNKRLGFLGIPTYWGSGLTEYNGMSYRFMVMGRLGTDLQKVIVENGGQLRKQTVLQLGCLMLDVLEYIHDNEYVHADIKAANLLLGHRDPGKVYLADYGLSYRYCPNGEHKEYKENPKKGHNGTIEYTSIDAHQGVAPSRRGDLEVLGYCLLHWQCGTLPWLSVLRNPVQVQEAKAKLIADLPDSVIQMSTSGFTTEVASFLLGVKALGYNEKPDYQALRKVLLGTRPWGPLDLSRPKTVETARPAMNRNSSSERSSKLKPVTGTEDEDGNRAIVKSILPKVRYRIQGESNTIDQEPWKAISSAEKPAKSRPVTSAEDDRWLCEVHGKTQEGTMKRNKQKSSVVSGVMRTDEAWLSTRKRRCGFRPRFIPDVSDHLGSNVWEDYCTSPSEEDVNWNGHQSTECAYEYTDDQYRHNNGNNLENVHCRCWSLEIYAVVIVALLFILVVINVF